MRVDIGGIGQTGQDGWKRGLILRQGIYMPNMIGSDIDM